MGEALSETADEHPYREAWEEGVDKELYEKALAMKRLHAMSCTIVKMDDADGWRVGDSYYDYYSSTASSKNRCELKDKYLDIKYPIELEYKKFFEEKREEWNKVTQDAVDYSLLDPNDIKECEAVNLDDEEEEDILDLSGYLDLIVKNELEIRSEKSHDYSKSKKYDWRFVLELKTIDNEDYWDGLDNVRIWIYNQHQRNKESVRQEAIELGILKNSPTALVKARAGKATAWRKTNILTAFGIAFSGWVWLIIYLVDAFGK